MQTLSANWQTFLIASRLYPLMKEVSVGCRINHRLPDIRSLRWYLIYTSTLSLVKNLRRKLMAQAKNGDTVMVHYTGKLTDGTVFDSSTERDPLQFTIGAGEIIPGFEQAVLGMNTGESKTTKIPVDEAYGSHRPEMVVEVERDQMPPEMEPEVGQQMQIQQPSGQIIPVMITNISDSTVTLDANHPLAGEDLIFDIQLVDITA
jgi:FKBP-type peptidyl-prolyl cis-trans isomerase 2